MLLNCTARGYHEHTLKCPPTTNSCAKRNGRGKLAPLAFIMCYIFLKWGSILLYYVFICFKILYIVGSNSISWNNILPVQFIEYETCRYTLIPKLSKTCGLRVWYNSNSAIQTSEILPPSIYLSTILLDT
jgi:hypothetical protein